jgi:hypothetical protein
MRNSKTQRRVGSILCACRQMHQRIDSALRFCLHQTREMARLSLAWFCFGCRDILHNARQSA